MASRRIKDLHPIVQAMCEEFMLRSASIGINVIITCTMRVKAEQAALYAQGRETLDVANDLRRLVSLPPITEEQNKRKVTWTMNTIHQFGLAFDFAIVHDRKAVWDLKADVNNDNKLDYTQLGEIAEGIGLEWGGRFKDYVHCQFTGGLTLLELASGKRPELKEG